jgi:hypothetical protein
MTAMTPLRRRVRPVRRARLSAVVLAAGVLAASCTVPRDDEARAIDPTRLVAATSNKRNCTSASVDAATIEVTVYLVSTRAEGAPPSVTPVPRVVTASEPTAREALDALFTCRVTTDESRERGLATSVPEQTQLLDLAYIEGTDGLYEVRLGPLQNRASKQVDDLDKLAVAQIFFTATGPGVTTVVKGLRFSIDGRAKAVSTDERTVSQTDFVRRDDFKSSAPQSEGPTATTVTRNPAGSSTTR